MSSYETTLQSGLKFFAIAVVTFAVATIGLWIANMPPVKEHRSSTLLSPAHWMFWVTGRDLEKELREPAPVFDPGEPVIPVWDSEQVGNFGRYLQEEQEKRDQMMDEISARWGTPK